MNTDPGVDDVPLGVRLRELAAVFLRLGTIAFGGPAAHVALMEDEVVKRRGWLTHQEFLDLLGATNLIPGPNSTEMAIHIGWRRARWPGLLVAGCAFILPAMLIVLACAWIYVRYRTLPAADAILYGVKPVIIAVVVQALWRLGSGAIRSALMAVAAGIAFGLLALGVHELAVLFGVGGATAVIQMARRRVGPLACMAPWFAWPLLLSAGTATAFRLEAMFLAFLKIGAVLFGSGYVLLAFLQGEFVERREWLTRDQLLDAVAIGQFTPGPLFTTATFIGYLLDGVVGAIVATVGIFLPAFFFVAISGPLVPRLRRSPVAGAFLDGVNVASLALMAWVTWELGRSAVIDWLTASLAAAAAVALIALRLNSAWLILAGGIAGLLAQAMF